MPIVLTAYFFVGAYGEFAVAADTGFSAVGDLFVFMLRMVFFLLVAPFTLALGLYSRLSGHDPSHVPEFMVFMAMEKLVYGALVVIAILKITDVV